MCIYMRENGEDTVPMETKKFGLICNDVSKKGIASKQRVHKVLFLTWFDNK